MDPPLLAAFDLAGLTLDPPIARVDAEGRQPGEAVGVDPLQGGLEHARDQLVVGREAAGEGTGGDLVDRLGAGEPGGVRQGMQGMIEWRPDDPVEISALRRAGKAVTASVANIP